MGRIVLAGGCFWCMEALFCGLKGVERVLPGYAGGWVDHPSYEEVYTDTTGHAEAVEILFNDSEIDAAALLSLFWAAHDPTQLNRQGQDVGTRYRSAVFYETEEQKDLACKSLQEVGQQLWEKPIVTTLEPLGTFFYADESHVDYFRRRGKENAYCQVVVAPKVSAFRKKFYQMYTQEALS